MGRLAPARYFGFEIPDRPGHYWYVWFDAPIGYIASTWQWCKTQGEKLDDWWQSPATEIHHFIGKDITYFHTLFWPGMLHATGHTLPKQVHIHGFLTVDGEKMSKSRGTFIMARTYLKHLDPAYLRYFYASKLSSRVEDLDLNLDEFKSKCDSDLVNKVVNIASRVRFVAETGLSSAYPDDGGLFAAGTQAGDEIAAAYEDCDFGKAMRAIMALADAANAYIDAKEPWKLRKNPATAGEAQDVSTVALNLFRQIVIYLAPVLPKLREQTAVLLNAPIQHWDDARTPLVGTPVAPFQPLLQRVDPAKVQQMIDDSKETLGKTPDAVPPALPASEHHSTLDTLKKTAHDVAAAAGKVIGDVVRDTTDIVGKLTGQVTETSWNDGPEALAAEPLAETCTIDDFAKVDLRVARIIKAEEVPEARKLLKLTVSLGGDQTRTVFAGIKAAYKPEELVGRLVVVVANLQPRQMKFGLSEGMVTAAGAGGAEVFLLSPDTGAKPGHRVH
ncbi:MAG: methionine--tRNA ligase subunit beta [Pirellulales bacterium]